MTLATSTLRSNCPRDCYDNCGLLIETRDDGSLRVLGDPEHPVTRGRLCSKCAVAYNGVWQDRAARLTQPLKRIGPKGSGAFAPISWEDAFAECATKLNGIIHSEGAQAILHTHYSGTLSLIAYLFPNRFFNAIGATEVDPDTICNAAGHVAWTVLFGNSIKGFDPRTIRDTKSVLVWGANPSHSAPHAHEHWLFSTGVPVIVVDPIRTKTAAAAAVHLQLRPGTDAALAFALLHCLARDGKFDHEFIAAHTVGADEVMATIEAANPAWGEAQTGVSATLIEAAAQAYGHGPSLLWAGQGLQRQALGGNIMRAIGLLPALTGNIGKPGAGFYYLNVTPLFAGVDLGWLKGAAAAPPAPVSHMDFAARLASPEFKALMVWNTNPLASAPRQQDLRAAFAREDLYTVAIDCFPTDTTAMADLVLPAASFLEFDDLTFSYFHLHMGAQSKAREPLGVALPNQEIFRRLAHAMKLSDPGLFETDPQLITAMLKQMNLTYSFADLKQKGFFALGDEAQVLHADRRFETPSGKIEIASALAVEMGLPRVPEARVDPPPAPGHLRLLSPASNWRLNDSYANDPHLREQAGPATVALAPADANAAGILDGSRVCVSNSMGELDFIAKVDPTLLPGTAVSNKGRWPALEANGGNINRLNPGTRADMGDSSAVHGIEVRVSPRS